MKLHHTRTFAVLAAAGILIGAANITTYAATGGKLILGKANKANHSTSLTNTGKGPALTLKSRASAPSLAVSSKKKVAHLNADMLDGLNSTAVTTNTVVYTAANAGSLSNQHFWNVPLPAGDYQLDYSVGVIPSSPNTDVACGFVLLAGTPKYFAFQSAHYAGDVALPAAWMTGGTALHFGSKTNVNLLCRVNTGTFTLDGMVGVRLTATKINQVTSLALTDGPAMRPVAKPLASH